MLSGEEEVVVFVEQCAVQRNKSLSLLVVELCIGAIAWGVLSADHLDALVLDYDKASVNALDFKHQLLLRDGVSFGLLEDPCIPIIGAGWS